MTQGLPKRRIRRRLVVHILIVGLLPLAVGLALTYHYGIQALRSTIGENFQEIAIETAMRLDAFINNEIRNLRILASLPAVVRETSRSNQVNLGQSEKAIRQRLLRQDPKEAQIQEASLRGRDIPRRDILKTDLSHYLRHIVDNDDRNVMGILITDRSGGLVASSRAPKQVHFGEDPWWQTTIEQGDVYVSGVLPLGSGSFESHEETIDIAMPIWDDSLTEILGVVKICYNFDNLFSAITEVRIGETGHAMLFDSNGAPLICPLMPRGEHRLNLPLLTKVRSPSPGWTIAADDAHGGRGTVVGFAPVKESNIWRGGDADKWYVFIRQDPGETYAPAYAMLRKVAILGGILAGVLALSGLYVGSRITRPISELQRGVKLIGEGQLDHRLNIRTHDEVEELALEFNRMAEKIKISQEGLRNFVNAVDHTADAVLITHLDGTISYANPAFEKLTGYTREEVTGQSPRLLRSGENDPKIYQAMWDTVLSGSVWRGELINRRKDGTLFHVELTVAPILDKTGRVVNLLGTERDITERKRLEEERTRWNRELELKVEERTRELTRSEESRREAIAQVLHAEKLASLGRMAAGIAHEIGNPLSSISAIAQVLEKGRVTETEKASYLHSFKHLVDRIDRIIRSLLAFSRPSLPELKPLDINQMVEEAIGITAPDFLHRKIVIEQELAHGLPEIQGDHDQLIQVFVNLFLNAADAVAAGGKIRIETRLDRKNEEAVIVFSDNGHGIPPEVLPKIFDPFYSTKGPGKGTGLGLSICRSIIEGLHGKIEVESEEEKGASFTISIPATPKTDLLKRIA